MADNVISFPTPTPTSLVSAIAAVMGEIHTVAKRGFNKFHNYKYVTMGDLLQAVTPLLAKHGVVIFQSETGRAMFDEDNVIAVQYAFTVAHTSGESWTGLTQTGVSTCRNSKGGWDDKSLNKCHTAARKYFLLSLFQIPTGDEADADSCGIDRFANVSHFAKQNQQSRKVTAGNIDISKSPVVDVASHDDETNAVEIETHRAAAQLKSKLPQYVVEPPKRRLDRALAKSRNVGTGYEAIIKAEQRRPTKFRQFDERNPPPSVTDDIPEFLDRRPR